MRQPQEARALGGTRYRSGIVIAGKIQYFEPATPFILLKEDGSPQIENQSSPDRPGVFQPGELCLIRAVGFGSVDPPLPPGRIPEQGTAARFRSKILASLNSSQAQASGAIELEVVDASLDAEYPGVARVLVRMPDMLPADFSEARLSLSVGGISSSTIPITIRPTIVPQ